MHPVYTQDCIVYPILQHPRGTQPLTPAMLDGLSLATYLGSWHHSKHAVRGVPEAHPGDDRTRAAMGWDQDRLQRAAGALHLVGLWERYNSPSTVEGKAWTLPVDLAPVPQTQGWRGRTKQIEAVLKCLVRGTPDLTSEARLLAVVLATRLIAWKPEQPVLTPKPETLEVLLPGVDIAAALTELEAAQIYARSGLGSRGQFPALSLHPEFLTMSREYMAQMGHSDDYGRHGETEWERETFARRGEAILTRAATRKTERVQERQYLYVLRDPRKPFRGAFYAGITSDPELRQRSHIETPGTGDGKGYVWEDNHDYNPAKRAVLEEIARSGHQVYMELVTPGVVISEKEARKFERLVVQGLYVLGLPLTNIEYIKGGSLPRLQEAQDRVEQGLAGLGLDRAGIDAVMKRVNVTASRHNRAS